MDCHPILGESSVLKPYMKWLLKNEGVNDRNIACGFIFGDVIIKKVK